MLILLKPLKIIKCSKTEIWDASTTGLKALYPFYVTPGLEQLVESMGLDLVALKSS